MNICLILALAFLQCLVPLLHAHAGGLHVPANAHIHFDATVARHSGHAPELTAELGDLPVVGAAGEFKRDPAVDSFGGVPPRTVWLTVPHLAHPVAATSSSILPHMPFRLGAHPSQAPPARV